MEFTEKLMKTRYNAEVQQGYPLSFETWKVELQLRPKQEIIEHEESLENKIYKAHSVYNIYLPINWNNKTFSTFETKDQKLQKLYNILIKQELNDNGFWLSGSVGCGKTHLLLALFNLISEKFYEKTNGINDEIKYYNYSDLCGLLRQDPLNFERFHKIRSPKYLFIDDVGVSKSSDFIQEKIYSLFNYRIEQNLPTFVTTNLGLAEVQKEFNDRIVSRIKESSAWIELTGVKDYRSNFIQNNMARFKDL